MNSLMTENTSRQGPASILSQIFWKSYWITMRPYLTFVSGAAGLTGLAFIPDPDTVRIILAFIPLFLSYGLGQALTDCFQIDTDSISSPYRPLVKGTISRKQVLSVSLAGLLLSILILAYLNTVLIACGVLVVIGLLSYTKLKRTWWGGPPWNAWIVAMLPVMGLLTAGNSYGSNSTVPVSLYSLPFVLAVGAIFFGYANFVVMGYFKDISADRKTSYRTFPVEFGWPATSIYSAVTATLAAACTGLVLLLGDSTNMVSIAVYMLALAVNLMAQVKIHGLRDESKAYGPIANVVRAFILYCITIILSAKSAWLAPVIIYYIVFEITLKFRPEKTQV